MTQEIRNAAFIAEIAVKMENPEKGAELEKFFANLTAEQICTNAELAGVDFETLRRIRRLAGIGLLGMTMHKIAQAIDEI